MRVNKLFQSLVVENCLKMTLQVPNVPVAPGLKLSQLIFGTWRLNDIPDSSLLMLIKHCLDVGITSFDCVNDS